MEIDQILIKTIQETRNFFRQNNLLTRACMETGITFRIAKRALDGPDGKVSMAQAIILAKWVDMWKVAQNEREGLRDEYKRMLNNEDSNS